MRILVIEDEVAVLRGLLDLLEAKGFEVLTASTGPEGLLKAREARPELILLDLMLPGMSGWEILKRLRGEKNRVPVIMLTAKGSEVDKVLGFELGVDDYVTKPFSILELLGRIQALLRRAYPEGEGLAELVVGRARIDFRTYELSRGKARFELPATAFEVLKVLARAQGEVVSRDRLIDEVWGREQVLNTRTIDNLVVKLRQAIEEDPENPHYLRTVHGRGYRLHLEDASRFVHPDAGGLDQEQHEDGTTQVKGEE